MADSRDILPGMVVQNPAPFTADTQDRKTAVRSQVDRIIASMMKVLPSNYVSQVQGPFYTMQFQAIAETIADFQITAQETMADSSYDFTRPEVLFQILGSLVFPQATAQGGWPTIEGDVPYRTFLQRMVTLLLKGATKDSVQGGIEALTTASVEVIERAVVARQMKGGSAWGPGDQFTFEINVSDTRPLYVVGEIHSVLDYSFPLDELGIDTATVKVFSLDRLTEYYGPNSYGVARDFSFIPESGSSHLTIALTEGSRLVPGTGMSVLVDYTRLINKFPDNPFVLRQNVDLVMKVLKPAHTIYDYRHLFKEVFSPLVHEETVQQWALSLYKYEDSRRYWLGVHAMTGTNGSTLTDRSLFSDTSRDFRNISLGATLTIPSGVNKGAYQVLENRVFPVGDDPTPRPYTTSPTGLSGFVTVSGSDVTDVDSTHDFATVVEDEILTLSSGPNAGSYRVYSLLGLDGGVIGHFTPPIGSQYLSARLSPSLLRVKGWMPQTATGQGYSVGVDRLGMQSPHLETGEDASVYFLR